MSEPLGFEVQMAVGCDDAIQLVTDALKSEGFGILTRIDAHTTFRQKLGREFRPFVILGACNPNLAHRALEQRGEAGLMLPCNVTVEESGHRALVRIGNPKEFMRAGGFEDDTVLQQVAAEAHDRLRRVADVLRQTVPRGPHES